MPPRENPKPRAADKLLREKVNLGRVLARDGIAVVAGSRWGLHYEKNADERRALLEDLLAGRRAATEVVNELRPDAIMYDCATLEQEGYDAVRERVLSMNDWLKLFDHRRFAEFIENLRGRASDAPTAEKLYEGFMRARVEKLQLDAAYGSEGKRAAREALAQSGQHIAQRAANLPRAEKVLAALKHKWICDETKDEKSHDDLLAQLPDEDRVLYESLKKPFADFIEKGKEKDFEKLSNAIRDAIPELEKEERSESQKKLDEELDQYKDAPEYFSENDPQIAPEDKDELGIPQVPPPSEEGAEGAEQPQPFFFEVQPADSRDAVLTGRYAMGEKSYFYIDRKQWSSKKQTAAFRHTALTGSGQVISARCGRGRIAIPVPKGFALDAATLSAESGSAGLALHRDQTGGFILVSNREAFFSIEFKKEIRPFNSAPIPADTEKIYRGSLSAQTEAFIAGLQGSNEQKAAECGRYVMNNHWYPGGGDFNQAIALQAKLLNESTGDTYVQNLDASEYLECRSANTLLAALMRAAGVPARFVNGHALDESNVKNGSAKMTSHTGHAWCVFWNPEEARWVPIDGTPPPKPQDKKKGDKKNKPDGTRSENADDGGLEVKPDQPPPTEDEVEDKVDQQLEDVQNQEISEGEMQQANQDQQQQQQQLQKMEQQKKEIKENLDKAKNFTDIKQLQEEIKKIEDMLEDMKEEVEDRAEERKEEIREEQKKKIDDMCNDGFIDEAKRDKLLEQLKKEDLDELQSGMREIDKNDETFELYRQLRKLVMPQVIKWYNFFYSRLPKIEESDYDDSARALSGLQDKRSLTRPAHLLTGLVANPRTFRPGAAPMFATVQMSDRSGSMEGEKLRASLTMEIFRNELFTRIHEEFGYIKYAQYVFSDAVSEVKGWDQDYASRRRYHYRDGEIATVRARLMHTASAAGGTNMLEAVRIAAAELNKIRKAYPGYMTAMYWNGDGEDSSRRTAQIRAFLNEVDSERGFGPHLRSATFLGSAAESRVLAECFGEEHTQFAQTLDELITKEMLQFDKDVQGYLKRVTRS